MNAKALLDRLPAYVRHALLIFIGSMLTWATAAAQGIVVTNNPVFDAALSSAGVSVAMTGTLWLTKLTKQYGIGATD
jgi:endo-beta-N-acetylglucosaminidase D